jgi:hypothetical protein
LAKKTAALEQERRSLAEQQAKLIEQVEILKREKALSEQKAQKEHQLLVEVRFAFLFEYARGTFCSHLIVQVTHDKVQLELERERSDEREFNAQLVQKLEQAARAGTPITRGRSSSAAGLPQSPGLSGSISSGGTGSPKKEHPGSLSLSGSRTPALKLNLISAHPSFRLGVY